MKKSCGKQFARAFMTWAAFAVPVQVFADTAERYRSNDIQMYAARYKDPGYRTGNSSIDGLSPSRLLHWLKLATSHRIAEFKREAGQRGTSSRILDDLAAIGPAASAALPVLIGYLNTSNVTEYFKFPSFCDLAKVLPKIRPDAREVGVALGANLLRAQKNAPEFVCHKCGCVLDAVAQTKGAAASAAGDYVGRYMQGRNLTSTYSNQLNKAIAVTKPKNIGSQAVRQLNEPRVHPDQKVGLVLEMLKTLSKMSRTDQKAFHNILRKFSTDRYHRLRAVSMIGLARWGKAELGTLRNGLADAHVEVRRASARGLGSLRAGAVTELDLLIENLDPVRGAAPEVSVALAAVGGRHVAQRIREKSPKAEPWASYYDSVALLVESRREQPSVGLIEKYFKVVKSPAKDNLSGEEIQVSHAVVDDAGKGIGYIRLQHRIRMEMTESPYVGPATPVTGAAKPVTVYKEFSPFWELLHGVQAGRKLKLYVSPSVDQRPHEPTVFGIVVEDVCEPKFWTVFRGAGIFGPIIFQIRCAR